MSVWISFAKWAWPKIYQPPLERQRAIRGRELRVRRERGGGGLNRLISYNGLTTISHLTAAKRHAQVLGCLRAECSHVNLRWVCRLRLRFELQPGHLPHLTLPNYSCISCRLYKSLLPGRPCGAPWLRFDEFINKLKKTSRRTIDECPRLAYTHLAKLFKQYMTCTFFVFCVVYFQGGILKSVQI